MNTLPRILCAVLLLVSALTNAKQLTVERIFSSPSLSGNPIKGLKISPDGSRVTFLKGKESDYERLDLWEYDIASGKTQILFDSDDLHAGKEELSDEEKARRERLRLRSSGIVSYEWSHDGKALLFPLGGDIYYYRLGDDNAQKLFTTPEFETDSRLSPQGNYVSFIREQNLFIYDLRNNQETQLTKDGGGVIKNGMAEFIAQEEMQRLTGYWWSGDESKIAFMRVDESPIDEVTRSEIYAEEIKTITQRYPWAGTNNALVQLGVIKLADEKEVRWVDTGTDTDIYLPRVTWSKDNNKVSYQWQSRDQKRLELRMFDWQSRKSQTLIEEESETWINLHKPPIFLNDGKHFVWASERDGFKHFYLYRIDGSLVRQLTKGPWIVDNMEHINEEEQRLYFTGRKESPLEKHLYSVSLTGEKVDKITQQQGFYSIEFADDGSSYLSTFSSISSPPQISLHKNNGQRMAWLSENLVDETHPLFEYLSSWIDPEFGSFKTEDDTELYYRLYKPADFDSSKKYPVFVYLYGGPRVQVVKNSWDRYLSQYMAQQGYVVFSIDNRGAAGHGKLFEDSLYRAMGTTEVDDQVSGVRFLHTFPWVDKDRVGVHGHSYGGYLTLLAMFKQPEYFKAGVAGAPVTDWALYDTHYTERYMGTPQDDAKAYENSSVFPYATDLEGPLLIYHGMADDNVLFKNSTKLYKLLQDNNIQFSVMDYPGKKHSIRGKKTQMHRVNMIRNFFDLHFGIKR